MTTVTLTGCAQPYGRPTLTTLADRHREIVLPGAFSRALADDADVRLLLDNTNHAVARTTNGTLRITDTPRGLMFEADVDTRIAAVRDTYFAIDRGDVSGATVVFALDTERAVVEMRDGERVKAVRPDAVAHVYSIKIVTFPLYPTDVRASQ